ncbi:MAG: FHA domain-containing protein [Pseudomonadota bacterium]
MSGNFGISFNPHVPMPTVQSPSPFEKNPAGDRSQFELDGTPHRIDCFALNAFHGKPALGLGKFHVDVGAVDLLIPSGPKQNFLIGKNPSHAIELPISSEMPVVLGNIYYQGKSGTMKLDGTAIKANVADVIFVNGALLHENQWVFIDEGSLISIGDGPKFRVNLIDPNKAPKLNLAKELPSRILRHTDTGTEFIPASSNPREYTVQSILESALGGTFSFEYGVPVLLGAAPRAHFQFDGRGFALVIERGTVSSDEDTPMKSERFALEVPELVTLGGVQFMFTTEEMKQLPTRTIMIDLNSTRIVHGYVNPVAKGVHVIDARKLKSDQTVVENVTELSPDDPDVQVLHQPEQTVAFSIKDIVYPIIPKGTTPFTDNGLGNGVVPNQHSPMGEVLGYLQIATKKDGEKTEALGFLSIAASGNNEFVFGRNSAIAQTGNRLTIDRDYVSREHAKLIFKADGSSFVADLGAKNQLYIRKHGTKLYFPLSHNLSNQLEDGDDLRIIGNGEMIMMRIRLVKPNDRRAHLK